MYMDDGLISLIALLIFHDDLTFVFKVAPTCHEKLKRSDCGLST
jgi:hypothetical protein